KLINQLRELGHARRINGRTLSGRDVLCEERGDLFVAVLGRSHRLDDVAGVSRMVVAVVADEAAAVRIGSEERALAFLRRDESPHTIFVAFDLVRREELAPLIKRERARSLLLVDRV